MGVTVTVSWNMMLYGSSRETNTSFLATSAVSGEMPSPVWPLMAKASAFQVVIVSGTSELCTAIPDALMAHGRRKIEGQVSKVLHCPFTQGISISLNNMRGQWDILL